MEMDAAELTHAYIQDEEKVAIPVTLWQQTMTLLLPSWLALDKEETSGFPPKVGRGGSKNYHTYNKVQNNFQNLSSVLKFIYVVLVLLTVCKLTTFI